MSMVSYWESISSLRKREDGKDEDEELSSNFPKWSSRGKCYQADVVVALGFRSFLGFSLLLGRFGLIWLIPHVICKFFVGGTFILMQTFLGRYIMDNVVHTWEMCPFAEGLLFNFFIHTCLCVIRHSAAIVFLMKYFFRTLLGYINFGKCEPDWAQMNCFEYGHFSEAYANCVKLKNATFCNKLEWEPAGMQYWRLVLGNHTKYEEIIWAFVNLLIITIIVMIITFKGIRSCEKVFPFIMITPFVLGSIVGFAAFMSPESTYGLKILFYLDYKLLVNPRVWVETVENTICSYGISILSLLVVSTHGTFKDDISRDFLVVFFADIFCCFLLAVPISTVIASYKHFTAGDTYLFENELDVFIHWTEAFVGFPHPSSLWAVLFFLSVITIALGNVIAMILSIGDAMSGWIGDKITYFWMKTIVGVVSVFLTIPLLISPYDFRVCFPTVALPNLILSLFTIVLCYGNKKLMDDYYFMMGYSPPTFFYFSEIICVLICLIVFFIKLIYFLPDKPLKGMVFVYSTIPCTIYLIPPLLRMCKIKQFAKFGEIFQCNPDWGPKNPILKRSRIVFNSKSVTKEFMYRQELYKKPFVKPFDFTDQNIVQLV